MTEEQKLNKAIKFFEANVRRFNFYARGSKTNSAKAEANVIEAIGKLEDARNKLKKFKNENSKRADI